MKEAREILPPPKVDDFKLLELESAVHHRWVTDQITVRQAWFEETVVFLQRLGFSIEKKE